MMFLNSDGIRFTSICASCRKENDNSGRCFTACTERSSNGKSKKSGVLFSCLFVTEMNNKL